jgi:predicted CxxxxCH...CXXCH cytochrome family protein
MEFTHMLTRFQPFAIIALSVLVACDLGSREPAIGEPGDPGPDVPPPNIEPLLGCANGCHGDERSNAPPHDINFETSTDVRTVGAHRNHMNPTTTWHRAMECADCHVTPTEVGDPGHIDESPAELTFGAVATAAGSQPLWDGDTCSNTYCHGSTLDGGTATAPRWTLVDGSQAECGSCHSFPPPAPHPDDSNCGACHPTMQPNSMTFLDPASHIDGKLDVTSDDQACDSCHGSGGVSAPPTDLAGNTQISAQGVGAHRAHLEGAGPYHEITCSQCHTVPTSVTTPGHIDGDNNAEVRFDGMNPAAAYNAGAATCNNLYCHGNGRDNNGSEVWNVDLSLDCNACHEDGRLDGSTMSGDHRKHLREGYVCADCHASVVTRGMDIIGADLHVNGLHEVVMPSGGTFNPADRRCTNLACHGSERW